MFWKYVVITVLVKSAKATHREGLNSQPERAYEQIYSEDSVNPGTLLIIKGHLASVAHHNVTV